MKVKILKIRMVYEGGAEITCEIDGEKHEIPFLMFHKDPLDAIKDYFRTRRIVGKHTERVKDFAKEWEGKELEI